PNRAGTGTASRSSCTKRLHSSSRGMATYLPAAVAFNALAPSTEKSSACTYGPGFAPGLGPVDVGISGRACPATGDPPVAIGDGNLSVRSHSPVRALRVPARGTVRRLPERSAQPVLRDAHRLTASLLRVFGNGGEACALTPRCAKWNMAGRFCFSRRL